MRNQGRGFQITCYKQRTESQNDTKTVDSKTGWQDQTRDRHAWLLCKEKQTQGKKQTEMLQEQLLGLLWPNANNNKNENPWNYNYKRKLPPQLIHWTCWVSLDVSLDGTQDGIIKAHALVMEAMVSWSATKVSLHATQWSWACPEIKDTTNTLYLQ